MKGERKRRSRQQNAMFGFRASGRRLAYSFAPHYREVI